MNLCGKMIKRGVMSKACPCMRPIGFNIHRGGCSPDLTGMKFGNFVVIEQAPSPRKDPRQKNIFWKVKNVLGGKEHVISSSLLVKGDVYGKQHGLSYTHEYRTVSSHRLWIKYPEKIKKKCYINMPFHAEWDPDKGGAVWKGAQWIRENLGLRPGKEWSMDIIDRNKGFVPGNLRWAVREEQARNKLFKKLGQFSIQELKVEARRHGYKLVKI